MKPNGGSESARVNHLATAPGRELLPDPRGGSVELVIGDWQVRRPGIDRLLHESNGSIGHQDIEAARVPARTGPGPPRHGDVVPPILVRGKKAVTKGIL